MQENNDDLGTAGLFLLVALVFGAVVVAGALVGIDVIHMIGNAIRWLGWA